MKIQKGTHAPFRLPCPLINPKLLAYRVAFTESCRYDIGRDQGDINKLFGIGYFPHYHDNSVRIGWNYDIVSGKINLFAYWYAEGVRGWHYLRSVNIGEVNYFSIQVREQDHIIDVAGRKYSVDVVGRSVGYLLRPYFGGNKTSPHTMIIDLQKI
jgi:hypothetical protein